MCLCLCNCLAILFSNCQPTILLSALYPKSSCHHKDCKLTHSPCRFLLSFEHSLPRSCRRPQLLAVANLLTSQGASPSPWISTCQHLLVSTTVIEFFGNLFEHACQYLCSLINVVNVAWVSNSVVPNINLKGTLKLKKEQFSFYSLYRTIQTHQLAQSNFHQRTKS